MELENNLLRFFKYATAWDAIVLLDEADIYLEQRSTNNLRRNSVVASKSVQQPAQRERGRGGCCELRDCTDSNAVAIARIVL